MDNELDLKTNCYKTTFTGLEIIGKSTKNEWEAYGNILKKVDEAKQWAIGDWLCDGKRHYGDGLYEKASKILEMDENYLRHCKILCEKLNCDFRSHKLTFTHHRELISINKTKENKKGKLELSDETDIDKIQEFLSKAEKEKMSVRDLRELVNQYKKDQNEMIRLSNEPDKYNVIYIDPPWPLESIVLDKWESPLQDKYNTMTIDEIKKMPISNIAYKDCSLFIWTTHTYLKETFDIIEEWGFKYHCCITWDKGGGWSSNGFHRRTEFCLYAYKGKININQTGEFIPTLISEPKTEHSKKPKIMDDILRKNTPEPRIEIFAREKKEGFTAWGNQL